MTIAKYREFKFGVTTGEVTNGADGVQYLRSVPLGDYATRITDRFIQNAADHPEKIFMAQRVKNSDGTKGEWRYLMWGDALSGARRIAEGLIQRGLSADRPVAILSENDLEHAQLILGCIYAGVPYCSVSSAYSLVNQYFEKLRHVLKTLTPGLIKSQGNAPEHQACLQAALSALSQLPNTNEHSLQIRYVQSLLQAKSLM
jgi:feruloyl-CoA synthase